MGNHGILPNLNDMWFFTPTNSWSQKMEHIPGDISNTGQLAINRGKIPMCPHTDLIQICSRLSAIPDSNINPYFCGTWHKGEIARSWSPHENRNRVVCSCIMVLANLNILLVNIDTSVSIAVADYRRKPRFDDSCLRSSVITTVNPTDIKTIWRKVILEEITDLTTINQIQSDDISDATIRSYVQSLFNSLATLVLTAKPEKSIQNEICRALIGLNISCPQVPKN